MRSQIQNLKELSELDLQNGANIKASWHNDYRRSAYVIASNLNFEMNEGDISVVFSQWGEIADILLMRDKDTGESRGFAFIAYADQRSTDLAVDNFNGSTICGRPIKVDHVKSFTPPTTYAQIRGLTITQSPALRSSSNEPSLPLYMPSGPDGNYYGGYRVLSSEEGEYLSSLLCSLPQRVTSAESKARVLSDYADRGRAVKWEDYFEEQIRKIGQGKEHARETGRLKVHRARKERKQSQKEERKREKAQRKEDRRKRREERRKSREERSR